MPTDEARRPAPTRTEAELADLVEEQAPCAGIVAPVARRKPGMRSAVGPKHPRIVVALENGGRRRVR